MARLLPFAFLAACASLFGILWIVFEVDPQKAPWFIFAVLTALIFLFVFCFLGTVLYFARTRLYKKYNPNWYFVTSFKMSFFVALFVAMIVTLAILNLVNLPNILLVIFSLALFAIWSYLGKKK